MKQSGMRSDTGHEHFGTVVDCFISYDIRSGFDDGRILMKVGTLQNIENDLLTAFSLKLNRITLTEVGL